MPRCPSRRRAATVVGVSDQAGQRSKLLGIKLRALVREHLDAESIAEPASFPPGAAVVHDDAAWVLLDTDNEHRLGAALAWMLSVDAPVLHVIADRPSATLTRRAAGFTCPITVWRADGRKLVHFEPDEPITLAEPPAVPAHHDELRDLIVEGGATPVVENGVLTGEVRGLEVCRVVDDASLDAVRLEVGTGVHDREMFQMIHGDVPTVESLRRIVDAVLEHRQPGVQQHPLSRLGAERMLRWELEQDPSRVGAVALAPAEPPEPRPNLKDPAPCVAHGTDADGGLVVVVCSVGVDVELVPYAADAYAAAVRANAGSGDVRLVLATPERDRFPIIAKMADLLTVPATFA